MEKVEPYIVANQILERFDDVPGYAAACVEFILMANPTIKVPAEELASCFKEGRVIMVEEAVDFWTEVERILSEESLEKIKETAKSSA